MIRRAGRLLRNADPQAGDGSGCLVRFCARSIASRLPSLRPSPLPSTPSAAARRGLVRALRQYYEARPTPRLFHGSFGSSPSCRGPGSPQRLRAGFVFAATGFDLSGESFRFELGGFRLK